MSDTTSPSGIGGAFSDGQRVRGESFCTDRMLSECGARCCHVGFHLADDEARAGHVRWHPDCPYHILQVGDQGRCFHLDPDTLRCLIYEKRPRTCRSFDCRRPESESRQ